MKIEVGKILLLISIVCAMLPGIIPEAILWLCLLSSAFMHRNAILSLIGNKIYRKLIIIIMLFALLFLLQLGYGSLQLYEIIRLLGLTKCIIAPFILSISFLSIYKERYVLNLVRIICVVFSLIYATAIILSRNPDAVSFQLGSVNGAAGVALIVLPAVVYCDKDQALGNTVSRFDRHTYCIITIALVILSKSFTATAILALQVVVYLIYYLFGKKMTKYIKRLMLLIFLATVVLSISIATEVIYVNPAKLRTRVGIWRNGFNQFTSGDEFSRLFGTGNDIVYMMANQQEAHNVFLEILLIYGIVGLALFILCAYFSVKKIIKISNGESKGLYMSLISYIVTIFLHPFYTGIFLFQILSLSVIMYQVVCRIDERV